MIKMFKEWCEKRHEYAKEWKIKTGGKVMGFFCTYVPEEILYAADILPVRIVGCHEPQDVTEFHLFGGTCSFCRDCRSQDLPGRYDYVDGIVVSQSCFPVRQTFPLWQRPIPDPGGHSLPRPHGVQGARAYPFLTSELVQFKKSIEDWTGKEITDADLDRGIEIMNESRRLRRQAFEIRKQANPPLTGLEARYLSISEQWVDKREHNRVLKDVLEKELPTRDLKVGNQVRLMILEIDDDDTEFIKMVEFLDAQVVIDDHGTDIRYFRKEVVAAGERLAAIAAIYADRHPCPTKDRTLRRSMDHVLKLVEDFKVQGAIIQQKLCYPHESDASALRKTLGDIRVPALFLERDGTVPLSQFKIRVEAFLETLRQEDLF